MAAAVEARRNRLPTAASESALHGIRLNEVLDGAHTDVRMNRTTLQRIERRAPDQCMMLLASLSYSNPDPNTKSVNVDAVT